MPSGLRIAVTLLACGLVPGVATARCQTGTASAPYIGAADMRAIDKAAATLPRAQAGRVKASIGASVPAGVRSAHLPRAIAKVLPQYRGYRAFRVGRRLAITDRRGILAYLMPLGGAASPGNCP